MTNRRFGSALSSLLSSSSTKWKLGIVLIVHFLIAVIRSPQVMIDGRFWAEEGSVFWSHARSSGLIETLLFDPGYGYFNLHANLMAYLGSIVAMRFAPLLTSWTSLLLAALPALAFLSLPLKLDLSRRHQFLITFSIMFLPAVTEPDIFANSLQLQVHFGVLAIILSFVDFRFLSKKAITVMVFAAIYFGLSGVHAAVIGSCLVLFELLRYLSESRKTSMRAQLERNSLLVGSAFLVGLMVQSAVFFRTRWTLPGELTHHRGQLPDLTQVAGYFSSNLSTIFLGRVFTEFVLEKPVMIRINFFLLLTGVLAFVLLMRKSSREISIATSYSANQCNLENGACQISTQLKLAFLYIVSMFFALFGFVSPIPNARYQTLPSVVLFLLIVVSIPAVRRRLYRIGFLLMVLVSSLIGMFYDPWGFAECRKPCATWPDQVYEAQKGTRLKFDFWPLHSSPPFDAPVLPPDDWCDDFNGLISWDCES